MFLIDVLDDCRFSPYEWRSRSYRYDRVTKYDFNLGNSFWFSMEALMLQGSDHCPRYPIIVVIIFVIIIVIMTVVIFPVAEEVTFHFRAR